MVFHSVFKISGIGTLLFPSKHFMMEAAQSHIPAIFRLPDEIICMILTFACLSEQLVSRTWEDYEYTRG